MLLLKFVTFNGFQSLKCPMRCTLYNAHAINFMRSANLWHHFTHHDTTSNLTVALKQRPFLPVTFPNPNKAIIHPAARRFCPRREVTTEVRPNKNQWRGKMSPNIVRGTDIGCTMNEFGNAMVHCVIAASCFILIV